ncbi:hypothetical protein L218DRAFT_1009608 [Marasmius fiardii PR-910]|nr:hypothetical protein L218DRAFT_1009608 [Marasmius fiardii PR-910]
MLRNSKRLLLLLETTRTPARATVVSALLHGWSDAFGVLFRRRAMDGLSPRGWRRSGWKVERVQAKGSFVVSRKDPATSRRGNIPHSDYVSSRFSKSPYREKYYLSFSHQFTTLLS